MTPVIIGNAELYQGDCRDVLESLTFDALVTDPVWPNCPPGLLAGADRPTELLRETLAIVTPKRAVIVLRSDSDPRFLSAVPAAWPFICLQAMPYAVPMYLGRVLGGTELAYAFGAPPVSKPGKRVIPMWGPKAQPSDRPPNGHPCSRALVHQKWLVHWWSEPTEIVCDPFMGSGTLAVACAFHGRRFIGIECESKFFDLACARLEDAIRQRDFICDEHRGGAVMSIIPKPRTLPGALAAEISRVSILREQYEEIQRGGSDGLAANCRPAIAMMSLALAQAIAAADSPDIQGRAQALIALQGFTA